MAHHLVLGQLCDYLTGETIADTHDERYRQKIARLLVDERGFTKAQVAPRVQVDLVMDGHRFAVLVDFVVSLGSRTVMTVRYGPGSIVTRERPTLAIARTLRPYVVPLAIVTNGEDAHILDVASGQLRATGLDAIPARDAVAAELSGYAFSRWPERRLQAERRILYAYDATDGCCDEHAC